MFRLTREVRFAVNPAPGPAAAAGGLSGPGGQGGPSAARATNSYAGIPAATGLGAWSTLRITLSGPLHEQRQYLCDIKEIDAVVRRLAVPIITRATHAAWTAKHTPSPAAVLQEIFSALAPAWPGARLEDLTWSLTPLASLALRRNAQSEKPMLRMSEKFEFSASHRLHNPALTDEENRTIYGRCSNPLGHGHNYELQVTVEISPAKADVAASLVPALERAVASSVVERFDHRNLNLEIEEFRTRIPSVENIAAVIYDLLKPAVAAIGGAKLAAVTVWETPKTWCEYSE